MRNLSVSKIEKAMNCPKHYKLKYIDKIPEPSSWVAHGGIVVHSIVEGALKGFGRSGKYPSWQDMDDQFEVVWNEQVLKTEGQDNFIGWKDEPKEPVEKIRAEYRPLVRLAREDPQALPAYRPWIHDGTPMVEQRLDLELSSPIGSFPLIGYIDLVSDEGVLGDWKTTSAKEDGTISERKMKNWLQAACYSIHTWPIVGQEMQPCEKVFLVRGPEPKVIKHKYVVGPKQRKFFTDAAAEVWRMTVQGGFPPNTNTWLCKADWCFAYQVCRGEADDESSGIGEGDEDALDDRADLI